MLDVHAGYQDKTAFKLPSQKYEYLKAPFGLAQTLAYFQELDE